VLREAALAGIIFDDQSHSVRRLFGKEGLVKVADVPILHCLRDDSKILIIEAGKHACACGVVSADFWK
jgi:hypothetical protein